MLRAMKYLLAVAALLSLTFPARAQKVDFEVGAPGVVAVGEAFRIEFTVNAKPDGFTPPAFGGFDVLAGPTTSEGTSVSIGQRPCQQDGFVYLYLCPASPERGAGYHLGRIRTGRRQNLLDPAADDRGGVGRSDAGAGRRFRRRRG